MNMDANMHFSIIIYNLPSEAMRGAIGTIAVLITFILRCNMLNGALICHITSLVQVIICFNIIKK